MPVPSLLTALSYRDDTSMLRRRIVNAIVEMCYLRAGAIRLSQYVIQAAAEGIFCAALFGINKRKETCAWFLS